MVASVVVRVRQAMLTLPADHIPIDDRRHGAQQRGSAHAGGPAGGRGQLVRAGRHIGCRVERASPDRGVQRPAKTGNAIALIGRRIADGDTGHDGRGGKQIGHARRTVFDVGGKRAVGGSGSRGQANRRGRGTPAGNVRRRGAVAENFAAPAPVIATAEPEDVPPLLEIVTPVPAGNAAFRNKPVKATVPGPPTASDC